jgi:hypothetical protein
MQGLSQARNDRRFFMLVAAAFATLVLVGFARTYYLRILFHLPPLSSFLEFHGALMSGWIGLLLVQTVLVATGRVDWHRKLGVAGAAYAALIIPVGCLATLGAAQREVRAHSAFAHGQLNVLGLELMQMLLFACFVGAALWLRRRTDIHKRLMIIATLCILPNAIVRLSMQTSIDIFHTNLAILSIWTVLVLATVSFDSFWNGRVHAAFARGAPIAIGLLYFAWWGSRTEIWDQFWSGALS